MNWLKEHIGQFVVGLLLLVIGAGLNIWWNNQQNQIQYLDFVEYKSESLFNKPNSFGLDTIRFSVNGKPVKDISELDIYFLNQSNSDFKDVPIIIEFDQPNDFETITQDVLDQNNAKELILPLELKTSKYVRFGYKVKLLSRKGDDPVLSLKYLIKGSAVPKFQVRINKEGVQARPYNKGQELISTRQLILLLMFSFVMFSLGVLGTVLFFKYWLHRIIGRLVAGLKNAKPIEVRLAPEEFKKEEDSFNNPPD